MPEWVLGVDFGTSFTVAAVATETDPEPRLVDVEGDGSSRLASAVWLDDRGRLVVGGSAIHQSVFAPERFEPTPKRAVGDGDVLLGDSLLTDVDLVAAVLGRAGEEARRVAGGTPPTTVVLTHPAEWGQSRQQLLREAAEKAGLPPVDLVEEPVAAAIRIGADRLDLDQHVVVYDFGGGTFDVAVLRRTATGMEVAGPPGGRDPLGGEDIDQRIIDHLSSRPVAEHPDWPHLINPPDVRWRRAAAGFRTEVRRAKEGLSGQHAWQLWVPGIEREVQITRSDLEELIEAEVDTTIDVVVEAISAAGIQTGELAAVYLIGGSSRIPMIADRVWKRLGQAPLVQDDPKTIVALGAAVVARRARHAPESKGTGTTGGKPPNAEHASSTGSPVGFVSRLALATQARFWTSGVHCYGYLTLSDADGAQVVIGDEPDPGGPDALAAQRAGAWPADGAVPAAIATTLLGTTAQELRNPASADPVDRYAIIDGRAVTARFDSGAEGLLGRVRRRTGRAAPAASFYQLPFEVDPIDGLQLHERLDLIRNRSGHRVTAESYSLTAQTTLPEWSATRIAAFTELPGYQWLSQATGRLLPSPKAVNRLGVLDGQVGIMHAFRVTTGTVPELTRVWVGLIGGRGYSVVATLPESDRFGFRLLLGHVVIVPGG
jgi:actin-like ATPase involved in cell morphogenesis